jgi:hypothetical protein
VVEHRPVRASTPMSASRAPDGYHVVVRCGGCGDTFARWITAEIAAEDLLRSRLLTTEN